MNNFRKILFVTVVLLCMFCIVACANKNKDVVFKDVLVENVSPVVGIPEDEPRAEMICDVAMAQRELESFGFSADTISLYDETYFEAHDLAVVLFITGVSYEEYHVEALALSGKELHITLLEKESQYANSLAVCKGILVEVEKGICTQDTNVVVKINRERE